ncbi:MAG TPA: hypothetical protein VG963_26335, partial [Polyangiaceae bacterium]|nr:hypothetical protein [Polyangiaceae bacterium]
MVPPGVSPGVPPAVAAAGLAQRTLMGVAPQTFAAHPAAGTQLAVPNPGQRAPAADPALSRALAGTTAPFEPVRNAATTLGTSGFPPLGRPTPSPSAEAAPHRTEALAPAAASVTGAAEPTAPEAAPPGPGGALQPLHARTQLGVAIPGIAPLRSGGGPVAAPAATELPAEEAAPPPLSALPPGRFKVPRGALVLLGSGVVLLATAIAFALLWTGAKPISATVASDPSGRERIDLVCSECPDGTQLTLGEASAEVRDRKAYLLPKAPLALGENQLRLGLQKPGGGLQEVEV